MKGKPIRWLVVWGLVFMTAYGGWYFVGALEMGVVDGPGVAPEWLHGVRAALIALLLPLGWIALRIEPSIGYLNLGSMLVFAAIVAVNSAVLVTAAYCVGIGGRRLLRRGPASR